MNRDGVEDTLDRCAADLADLHRFVAHGLHDLEPMAVRAAVFVDRHPRSIIWRGLARSRGGEIARSVREARCVAVPLGRPARAAPAHALLRRLRIRQVGERRAAGGMPDDPRGEMPAGPDGNGRHLAKTRETVLLSLSLVHVSSNDLTHRQLTPDPVEMNQRQLA